MLAVGAKWAPDQMNSAKPWVAQLKNHRYHSSKPLTEMQRELAKVRAAFERAPLAQLAARP